MDRLSRLLTVAAVVAIPSLLAVPAASAQDETCQVLLQDADAAYRTGRFDEVLELVGRCLTQSPPRNEIAQSHELRAKTLLATDQMDAASAAVRRLLDADPDFEADPIFDSTRFVRLVDRVRAAGVVMQVTSVSKSKEPLAEAPAAVQVVTGEEIERRGYVDLEQLIHDLPGFDVTRTQATPYSNIYPRGFRTIETNRILLLVDGVEDNDLASSVVYLSRQFPLSNIERVEVVYGPTSTMYGPNAFAGVINIITKEPDTVVAEGARFGTDSRFIGGSWNTYSLDSIVAGRTKSGSVSWSLAGRLYQSDEYDRSDFEDWDYAKSDYDGVDYQSVGSLNVADGDEARTLVEGNPELEESPFFEVVRDADGEVSEVRLTDEGEAAARALDQSALDQIVAGHPIGYTNHTDDWMLYGKLRIANMLIGIQSWYREEGGSSVVPDRLAAGSENGSVWIPKHSSIFVNYSRRFVEDTLTFTFFTRYKLHELDGDSADAVFLSNYARGSLGVEDLLAGAEPSWDKTYIYRSNNQLRTEFSLFYNPSERFNVVGGVEARWSSIGKSNITSSEPDPARTGTATASSQGSGGNVISSQDLGLYVQASYRPLEDLKVVVGGRVDDNTSQENSGYGTVFNPRLAVVYTPGDLVFKAIYATAFQDNPSFQKFVTNASRQLPNPDLDPEEVENVELSAGWNVDEELFVELIGYQSEYSNIVDQVQVPCDFCEGGTTNQFQNVGTAEVTGLQAAGTWSRDWLDLYLNYTYTDAEDTERNLVIQEIANHKLNVGANARLFERWNASLRVNYVGTKDTGPGTTQEFSPLDEYDDYFLVNTAVRYQGLLDGLSLQLVIDNLLDESYVDPGWRDGAYRPFTPTNPQPERSFFLQVIYRR